MKPRILILPFAAAVIFGLVVWRLSREERLNGSRALPADVRQLAPRFELYDQHSQLVKFERYLGRTRIGLLFIGAVPAGRHALVQELADRHEAIKHAGIQIVVVGLATPAATRESERALNAPLPFPVLTDINLKSPEPAPTHRQWGLAGETPDEVREGLFLIDRDGTVRWSGTAPQPASDPAGTIEALARGDWP